MSSFLLGCAARKSLRTTVVDSDAFYSTHMREFDTAAGSGQLVLFPNRSHLEARSLVPLISSRTELLVIDDLNSLYSMFSDARRSQQLAVMLRFLAYNAKVNASWVVATAYGADLERPGEASRWSVLTLGDILVDTKVSADSVMLTVGMGGPRPEAELLI